MTLKRTLTQDEYDALDDALKALYAEGDDEGTFALDVEADPRVDEFRQTNIKLKRQVEAKEKEAKPKPNLANQSLQERLDAQEDELKTLREERDAERAKAAKTALRGKIMEQGKKLGARSGGPLTDLMSRATGAGWTVQEEAAVCLDSEGEIVMRGNKPLTLGRWLSDLKSSEEGSHLFNSAKGSAGGWPSVKDGKGTGGAGKVAFDMSPQEAIAHIDAIASGELVLHESDGV